MNKKSMNSNQNMLAVNEGIPHTHPLSGCEGDFDPVL